MGDLYYVALPWYMITGIVKTVIYTNLHSILAISVQCSHDYV